MLNLRKPNRSLFIPLLSGLSLVIVGLVPGVGRADVAPWSPNSAHPNEVVYTLDISCAGVGIVCDALDAYSDTQVAGFDGEGTIEVDFAAGTFHFLQDGSQDLNDGVGPRPAYASLEVQDLTFAEIPFVGAPTTDAGVIFALTNPIFDTGGAPLTVGPHPVSAVVSYSAVADIVGPVDAYLPELALQPADVTLSGTLVVLALPPGGGIVYRIDDLTGSLQVSNPTTLLGEDVVVTVTTDLTLNLSGQSISPGGVSSLPALGGSGTAALVVGLAAIGAWQSRRRHRGARIGSNRPADGETK